MTERLKERSGLTAILQGRVDSRAFPFGHASRALMCNYEILHFQVFSIISYYGYGEAFVLMYGLKSSEAWTISSFSGTQLRQC